MPAVTADTLTLPRLTPMAESTGATGHVGHHGAHRIRGRGLPGAPRLRRACRWRSSTRSSTWTRWARSSTPPASRRARPWHPHRGFETFTYLIDGQFIHQDSHGGGGTIDDGGTQYMTAGDGLLHIETPARGAGRVRWPVPRPAAVDQPAPGEEAHRPAVPGPPGPRPRPCSPPTTAAHSCACSPASVDGHAGPGHLPHAARHHPHHAGSGCADRAALAGGVQRPRLCPLRHRHGRARSVAPSAAASWPSSGPASPSSCRPMPRRSRARRASRSSSSAACRCASRSRPTGPSSCARQAELIEAFEDFQAGRLGTVPAGAIQPHRV